MLNPENLVIKQINGNPITGRGLLECFKVSSSDIFICL